MNKEIQKDNWNNYYNNTYNIPVEHDNWAEVIFSEYITNDNSKILDLGCGFCPATRFLFNRNYDFTALDYSELAINYIEENFPSIKTIKHDLRELLPFNSSEFDYIIADLSLHYFSWDTTVKIFENIVKILKDDGRFLLRLNSTNDIEHGAGQGEKIENNYYLIQSNYKRFFDQYDLNKLLSVDWDFTAVEKIISRKNNKKVLWEVSAKKG